MKLTALRITHSEQGIYDDKYYHVRTSVCGWDTERTDWDFGYDSPHRLLIDAGLTLTSQAGGLSGTSITGLYAIKTEFKSEVTTSALPQLAKKWSAIQRKLDKLENDLGYTQDYVQILARLALAMNIKSFVISGYDNKETIVDAKRALSDTQHKITQWMDKHPQAQEQVNG